MVVDKNTPTSDIEETFKAFLKRGDIDIILINQNLSELIRHAIDAHSEPIPAILEIPSKDGPWVRRQKNDLFACLIMTKLNILQDPTKDSILRRAKGLFSADDYR